MIIFRDFLKEQFKDKEFEAEFYKGLEKLRIANEIAYYREKKGLTQAQILTNQKGLRWRFPFFVHYLSKNIRIASTPSNWRDIRNSCGYKQVGRNSPTGISE